MHRELKVLGTMFTVLAILFLIPIILLTLFVHWYLSLLFMIPLISLIVFWTELDFLSYMDKLNKGENRKIRKQKRCIKRLEAQKNFLENKKEREGEIINLNCKIHNLKLELKGKHTLCEQCGAKIYRNNCFCAQCGYNIKEEK